MCSIQWHKVLFRTFFAPHSRYGQNDRDVDRFKTIILGDKDKGRTVSGLYMRAIGKICMALYVSLKFGDPSEKEHAKLLSFLVKTQQTELKKKEYQ